MPFVSVTRLRIRSMRFLPHFGVLALRSTSQVRASAGFLGGALLPDRKWTFWTLTVWDSAQAMRAYITTGSHLTAMPRLLDWCDEASIVHWDAPDATLPGWQEADARMRGEGRPSKVRHPSADHTAMTFAVPRSFAGNAIQPKA